MTTRPTISRSIAGLLTAAAMLLGTGAPQASAAQYTVRPCLLGTTAFPGAEMLGTYQPKGANTISSINTCAGAGTFQIFYGPPSNTLLAGSAGGWSLTVPAAFPNATIVKVTSSTEVGARSGDDFAWNYYNVAANSGYEGGGLPGGANVAAQTLLNDTWWNGADGLPPSRSLAWVGEPSGNHHTNIVFSDSPNVSAFNITVVLDDSVQPTMTPATTGLLDGSDQYGKRIVSLAGVDVDSGVKTMSVATTDGQSLGSVSGTCTYQSVEACQREVDGDFALDTSKLSLGVHTLKVTITDGAGNVRVADTPAFKVAAPPAATPTPTPAPPPGTNGATETGGSAGTTPTTPGGLTGTGGTAPGPTGTGPLAANGNPKGTPLVVAGSSATKPSTKPESVTATFGKRFTIKGRLLAADATPMAGATLDVFQTLALPGSAPTKTATIVTDAKGQYSFSAPAGGSASYRIAYPTQLGGNVYPAARTVGVTVRATATLTHHPAGDVKRGAAVTFSGKVGAATIPAGGARIAIQYHATSGAWLNADVITTDASGAYTWKHAFRTAARYRLRTKVLTDKQSSNASGISRELRFRVR